MHMCITKHLKDTIVIYKTMVLLQVDHIHNIPAPSFCPKTHHFPDLFLQLDVICVQLVVHIEGIADTI